MKKIIIAAVLFAGFALVLLVVNPVLVLIQDGPGSRIESKLSLEADAIVCDLRLRDAKEDRFITELSLSRPVAERLKIAAPAGFRAEPLADAKSDPAWVENWNRENVRFTGRVRISPDMPLILTFPAAAASLESTEINGRFETGKTFGNVLGFFKARP